MIGAPDGLVVDVRGGGDFPAVPSRSGDGPGVHQAHGGKLTLAGLGTLAVGEVAGGVPEAQAIVGGHVPRAEAGPAEAGFDDRAALQQVCRGSDFRQLQADGHAGGVHVKGKVPVPAALSPEDVRRLGDVVEEAPGAPGDDPLVRPDAAVVNLLEEVHPGLGVALAGVGLHLRQDVGGIVQELPDGPGVGRVEGQGDHGLDLGEVQLNVFVVVREVSGAKLPVFFSPAVGVVEAPGFTVRLPDGGEAGGLRGHHVHAVPIVDGQPGDARPGELQHAVVHKAAFKGGLHQGDGHVVGAHAPLWRAGEVDQDHLGVGHVPGVFQKLLTKLRPALAHGHGPQGPVTGVGVGTQDHLPAARQLLPGVGVDNALVGGDIDAAVFPGGGEPEDMVVLVDGAPHGAEGVVAVGQGVGNGKFPHTGGSGLLDDAHVGDVVAGHGVEADPEFFGVPGDAVSLENAPGQGPFPALPGRDGSGGVKRAAGEEDAVVV